MRLRKWLDLRHAQGVEDGRDGRPPNPAIYTEMDRRGDWAYAAGYAEGRRMFERIVEATRAAK